MIYFIESHLIAIIVIQIINSFLAGWLFGEEKRKQDAVFGAIAIFVFGIEIVAIVAPFIAIIKAWDWIEDAFQIKFYYSILSGYYDTASKGKLENLNAAAFYTSKKEKMNLPDNSFVSAVKYLSKLHHYNYEKEKNENVDAATKSILDRTLLPYPLNKIKKA